MYLKYDQEHQLYICATKRLTFLFTTFLHHPGLTASNTSISSCTVSSSHYVHTSNTFGPLLSCEALAACIYGLFFFLKHSQQRRLEAVFRHAPNKEP